MPPKKTADKRNSTASAGGRKDSATPRGTTTAVPGRRDNATPRGTAPPAPPAAKPPSISVSVEVGGRKAGGDKADGQGRGEQQDPNDDDDDVDENEDDDGLADLVNLAALLNAKLGVRAYPKDQDKPTVKGDLVSIRSESESEASSEEDDDDNNENRGSDGGRGGGNKATRSVSVGDGDSEPEDLDEDTKRERDAKAQAELQEIRDWSKRTGGLKTKPPRNSTGGDRQTGDDAGDIGSSAQKPSGARKPSGVAGKRLRPAGDEDSEEDTEPPLKKPKANNGAAKTPGSGNQRGSIGGSGGAKDSDRRASRAEVLAEKQEKAKAEKARRGQERKAQEQEAKEKREQASLKKEKREEEQRQARAEKLQADRAKEEERKKGAQANEKNKGNKKAPMIKASGEKDPAPDSEDDGVDIEDEYPTNNPIMLVRTANDIRKQIICKSLAHWLMPLVLFHSDTTV